MKSFMIELIELEDDRLKVIFKVKKDYLQRQSQLLLYMIECITDIALIAERFYGAEMESNVQNELKEENDVIAIFVICQFQSEEEREEFEIDTFYSFF